MLTKPQLPDEQIVDCLCKHYSLAPTQITFLPLGADLNTAVYRAVTQDGAEYFVKLRSGAFDEITVTLPQYIHSQGNPHIIPPLATRTGALCATLAPFAVIVYPFVHGQDGYHVRLSDEQWRAFGAAVKHIHSLDVPLELRAHITRENYSPQWRNNVAGWLERVTRESFTDPTTHELGAFIKTKYDIIAKLIADTERLAHSLESRAGEFVLCHTDLHAGNILITANGAFYIVDWDNPTYALAERDLMFIGGGQGFVGRTAREEELLFYEGYGQTRTDSAALRYYRCERIIEDLAVECDQIFLMQGDASDRAQALHYFKSNFLTGGTLESAFVLDSKHTQKQ